MTLATLAAEATTDDVVAWLLGPGHLCRLDEQGRAIGEQASPRYDALPDNEEEHRRFGDARDDTGLPCNVAALRQMTCVWPRLLATLACFESHRPPTVHRLYRRVSAGTAFARLLALRAPTGALPVEVAALFKVTLGFGELLAAALIEGRVDADAPSASLTAGWLNEWLDERPWLVGESQVCGGTRGQLARVWASLGGDGDEGVGPADWHSGWFAAGLDALTELSVLAAAAAGAARSTVATGGDEEGSAAGRLYLAVEVPRVVETLRQATGAGVAHPTLLYPANEVPETVRRFVGRFGDGPLPLAEVDEALEHDAGPAAGRLMRALGREPCPLSAEAFRRACR